MSDDNSNSPSEVPLVAYILPLPPIVGILFCVIFMVYQQRKKRAMRLAVAQAGAQQGQAAPGQMPVYRLTMSGQSIVYQHDGMNGGYPQGSMAVFNSHHGVGLGVQNPHMPAGRHPSSPGPVHYGSPQTGMDGGIFRK